MRHLKTMFILQWQSEHCTHFRWMCTTYRISFFHSFSLWGCVCSLFYSEFGFCDIFSSVRKKNKKKNEKNKNEYRRSIREYGRIHFELPIWNAYLIRIFIDVTKKALVRRGREKGLGEREKERKLWSEVSEGQQIHCTQKIVLKNLIKFFN